ncbi:MAG TPA: hypothetical protein VGA52_11340 [Anaerolineales bacterium]|jgi:uncharacterized membrane protein
MATIKESLIVKTTAARAYRVWRDRPQDFMTGVESVETGEGRQLRWSLETEDGQRLQWTTEQTMDEAPHRLAWSGQGGDLQQSGQVTFHQLNDDQVEVSLMTTTVAGDGSDEPLQALGDLRARWQSDLSRFKALLEGRLEPD